MGKMTRAELVNENMVLRAKLEEQRQELVLLRSNNRVDHSLAGPISPRKAMMLEARRKAILTGKPVLVQHS